MAVGGDTYSFAYDANGNQITENTDRHFEWDFSDKLRSFRVQAGTSQPTKFAHYLMTLAETESRNWCVSQAATTGTTYIDGIFRHMTDGTDTQNTLHVMDDKSKDRNDRLGMRLAAYGSVKYVLENHIRFHYGNR